MRDGAFLDAAEGWLGEGWVLPGLEKKRFIFLIKLTSG